ncbi:MAG: metal-dependent hydrolase [Bacteroidota bacterium]
MDSLTQIVLGAAVGEAVLGKEVGNRAALWGAICGTIPDLDVIGGAFTGELASLVNHRAASHSILFSVLAAPVMGWLLNRYYRGKWGDQKSWTWLAFWAFFTHPLLDSFTTWGTQLFYPFSDYRVAFNNIFVVDPLYTLPFLICLLLALRLPRTAKWRLLWNWIGIGISSFYLILTLTNKLVVHEVFSNALHQQGVGGYGFSTYPTPFNSLLWYAVKEDSYGRNIYTGTYSILGDPEEIEFRKIPKNSHLIKSDSSNYVIDRLLWTSKGQFTLTEEDSSLIWNDMRFGMIDGWEGEKEPVYTFSYKLLEKEGEFVEIEQLEPGRNVKGESQSEIMGTFLGDVWRRIWE